MTPPLWDAEVDFVVAGAGTAGCVLANRLSADPGCQVLLLEAGGGDRHPLIRMPVAFTRVVPHRAFNWHHASEPEPHLGGRVVPIPRGKVLGGSSSINGLFHIRGHRLDFDDWAAAGCQGWAYRDVLPYFIRSESSWRGAGPFHGDGGPVQVRPIDTPGLLIEPLREAARQAGHPVSDDHDGDLHDGVARGEAAIDARGRRHSSARAYLDPVRGRANLQVWTRTLTDRVIVEDGRALGVEVWRGARRWRVRARREVVLSGGAYGSPAVLLRSGIGPAAELQALGIKVVADLPGVGANLAEHPRLPLMFEARQPVTFLNQLRLDRAVVSALRWWLTGRGPFANQVCHGTVLLRSSPAVDRPDVQLLCNPVRFDARLWFPGLRPVQRHAFYVTVCQLYPRSRGRVSLRSSRAQEAPRIALNLFSDAGDAAVMRQALRAARAIYAQPALAPYIGTELTPGAAVEGDEAIDRAIAELGGITHHPVGTCAMGTGAQAVVDAALRVHGVQGLRVVDASIMPGPIGGNTNATTLMVAEKGADLILGRAPAGAAA